MTKPNQWDFLHMKTEHELTETATRYDMDRPLGEITEDCAGIAYLDDGTGDYGISGDALTKLTRGARP